jgi:hypothetical protein
MTQVDVSLTDYALTVECAWFAYRIARLRTVTSLFRAAFMVFFFSIAVAAAAGGTVHGFFLDKSLLGYRILWPFTLIVMGITALSGVHIAAALQFSRPVAVYINRVALAGFLVYIVTVLFIRRDFLVAILGYLPALIFVGEAFLLAHLRKKTPAFLVGFLGVCVMLFAAVTQQAKLGIDPRYFDHNALYHVLQAVALFMLFFAARESVYSGESIN